MPYNMDVLRIYVSLYCRAVYLAWPPMSSAWLKQCVAFNGVENYSG